MIQIIIYSALIWAIYQVYQQLFQPAKKEGCSKCVKNLKK